MADNGTGQSSQRNNLNFIAYILIGFGIGCLTGLSVSPVVSNVISSLLAIAAATVGVLSGVKLTKDEKPKKKTDSNDGESNSNSEVPSKIIASPWPLTWLVVGIVLGSGLGVWARTHNWLGTSTVTAAEEIKGLTITELRALQGDWQSMGLERHIIAQRFFDLRYPFKGDPASTSSENGDLSSNPNSPDVTTSGILFSISTDECDRLLRSNDENLLAMVDGSPFPEFSKLAAEFTNPAELRSALENGCEEP